MREHKSLTVRAHKGVGRSGISRSAKDSCPCRKNAARNFRSKKFPLSKEDKAQNRETSRQRVLCENVIGVLKRFKIIADKYRNCRMQGEIKSPACLTLRFALIAAIYNRELSK